MNNTLHDEDYLADIEKQCADEEIITNVAYPIYPYVICGPGQKGSQYLKHLGVHYYVDPRILYQQFYILDLRTNKRSKKTEFFMECQSEYIRKYELWVCSEWVVPKRPSCATEVPLKFHPVHCPQCNCTEEYIESDIKDSIYELNKNYRMFCSHCKRPFNDKELIYALYVTPPIFHS